MMSLNALSSFNRLPLSARVKVLALWGVFCVLCASPGSVFAFPSISYETDVNDDATLQLKVLDTVISGDAKTWCEVRLTVISDRIALSNNDTAEIIVYRQRSWYQSDEKLWEKKITFTNSNIHAGRFDETFDCTGIPLLGSDGAIENLYAWAVVEKDQCGFWCRYDRPQTDKIPVVIRVDDDFEPDNTSNQATQLGLGLSPLRISRDQDWLYFTLQQASRVTLEAQHTAAHGRLDLALVNPNGTVLKHGDDASGRTYIENEVLAAGDHFIRVSPRVQTEYNFYKINFLFTTVQMDCFDGHTDTQACGHCGERVRTCANGRWGEWSSCEGEGVCQAGATRKSPCGLCGNRQDTCSTSCQWQSGPCSDEGECNPGVIEERSCGNGGMQQRRCDSDCGWLDFDECLVEKRIGDACSADSDCVDDWQCLKAPEESMFVDGYCGLQGCKSDDECGTDALCAELFERTYCLKKCTYGYDCRMGYLCEGDSSRRVCMPECTKDEDCRSTEKECNQLSGFCVAKSASTPGTGTPGGQNDVGYSQDIGSGLNDLDGVGVEAAGCGCNSIQSPNRLPLSMLVIMAALAMVAFKRRSAMP